MPKIKSHSGAKKRFKASKTGKIKYKKQGLRHLLTGMPASRGRKLRTAEYLGVSDTKTIKKELPYL